MPKSLYVACASIRKPSHAAEDLTFHLIKVPYVRLLLDGGETLVVPDTAASTTADTLAALWLQNLSP